MTPAECAEYQALLEQARSDPDDEELQALLERVRAGLEVSWLRHCLTVRVP